MASQTAQNIGHQAGEITGQAQIKKDEIMNQASQGTNSQSSDQTSSYASQATHFLQQTGEQVKTMAQGAADAVKNTLGMNNENTASNAPGGTNLNTTSSVPSTNQFTSPSTNQFTSPSTNHPSNPSPRT